MKGQRVTKSSKFTQVGSNDTGTEYQNIVGLTVLPPSASISPSEDSVRTDSRSVHYAPQHQQNVIDNSSEMLLQGSYEIYKAPECMHDIQRFSPETNANHQRVSSHQQTPHQHDIELCNCIVPIYPLKTRFASNFKQQTELNRSYASLPKLMDVNQTSLDRKNKFRRHHQQPTKILQMGGYCDRAVRAATLGRMPSPEIINIHRGGYDHRGNDEFKCKEHELRRGKSMRAAIGTQTRSAVQNRRSGDGMDAEVDDPEIVFEVSQQNMGECQCPCDHVIYSPSYPQCIQEERPFGPAPDVTRRLGASTTNLGKPELSGSPPYYRSNTSAGSSSSNSTSSRA